MSVKPDSSLRRRCGCVMSCMWFSSVDGGTTGGESARSAPGSNPRAGDCPRRLGEGMGSRLLDDFAVQVLEQQDVGVQDARAIVSVER